MRKRLIVAGTVFVLPAVLLGALVLGTHSFAHPPTAAAHSVRAQVSHTSISLQDFYALFFVWASGTPAVQHLAAADCARLQLTTSQCASVSAAVRSTWLDLAEHDPAALGRPETPPNLTGRAQALNALYNQLATILGGQVSDLVSTAEVSYAQINQPQWIHDNVAAGIPLAPGTVLVWATSYSQSSLPHGLNTRRSPYAALPDAYLKFANWGTISNIPSIYQPFYVPSGGKANWTVNIANASGKGSVSSVLITDVGPWNEDDNWWDPNGASTTLPASCPVSSTLVAPDSTSNALVNGICPSGTNLRRIYYYLLYQHFGLPFFAPGGYAPTGSFADGTAWPLALPQYCSEAAAASKNNDGITCYSGASGYNNTNGGWLRNSTFDTGITNQSSIDVSPAVDKALGWVYPSSGLVQVTVSNLP
jgi:hypothetical protein